MNDDFMAVAIFYALVLVIANLQVFASVISNGKFYSLVTRILINYRVRVILQPDENQFFQIFR